ncbi:MAG: tetratricopeptide repeat protein [Pseudomonadota bacterium]
MTRTAILYRTVFAGCLALIAGSVATAQSPEDEARTRMLDQRHKACLERIAEDQELAFEEAMIWRDQGGGRRARHCEAMALFALGHEGEAARRLDELAEGRDGGSEAMRLNFRSEAANFWLAAEEADKAYASATAGLDYDEENADLRIARARAHVQKGEVKAAEEELNRILSKNAGHAEALRYRADTRLRQGRLTGALDDAEASLVADPDSVETALLRGRIKEAIRLFEVTAEPDLQPWELKNE